MAQLRPTAGLRPMSTLYAARPPAESSASSCSSSVSGDAGDYTDARPPGIFYWNNGDSIILLRTLLDVLGTSDGTSEPLVSVVYRMLPARVRESRSATSVRLRINLLQQWCHTNDAMRGLLAWLETLNPAGVANLGDWPVDENIAPSSSPSPSRGPVGLLYTDEYTVGGRDDVVSVPTSGMTGPRYMSPSHALVPNGGIISIRSSNSSNSSGSRGSRGDDHSVTHPRRGLLWNNAESILLLRVLLHVRDTHDVSGMTFVQLVNLVHAALPAPVRDARLNTAVRMRLEMLQQWCLPYGGARAWCQTDEGIREMIAWLETMDPDDVADHRDWRLASDNTTRLSSDVVSAALAAGDTEWVTPLAMRRLPRAATLARPRYTDGDGGGDDNDDNVGGIVDANVDPDANFPWCNGDTLILARIMRHARVRDASMVSYRALTRLLPDCIVRHRRPMSIRVRIQLILAHASTGVLDKFIQDLEQQDADGECHLDDLPHPTPAHPVGHPPQPVRPRMLPIAGVPRKKKVWCNAHMLAVVRVLLALQWTVRAPVPHDRVYALLPAGLKDEWRQSQILERTRRFVYMLRDEAHFARVQLALEKSSAMRAFDSALVNRLIHGYFNKGAIAQSVVQKRKVVIARPQPQPRSQPPAPSILTPRVRRVARESEEDQADEWEYQEQETIRALVSLAHHAAIVAEDRPAVVGGEPPFRRRASPIPIPPSPPVRPRFKRGRLYPAPIVISDSSSDDEDYTWHRPAPVMPFQDRDSPTPEPPAVSDSTTTHKITLQVADE